MSPLRSDSWKSRASVHTVNRLEDAKKNFDTQTLDNFVFWAPAIVARILTPRKIL